MRKVLPPVLIALAAFVGGVAAERYGVRSSEKSGRRADAPTADSVVRVELTHGPQAARKRVPMAVKVVNHADGSSTTLERNWSEPDGSWYYVTLEDAAGRRTTLVCAATP